MAKDKKTDYSKLGLDLGKARPLRKAKPQSTVAKIATPRPEIPTVADQAVEQIHQQQPTPEKKERTRRVTLDIPDSLHRRIKQHVFERGMSLKEYFLRLASTDLTN